MAKKPDKNVDVPEAEDPFGQDLEDFFNAAPAEENEKAPAPPREEPASEGVDMKVVNLTSDIPVQIVAVLAKKSLTVKEVVALRKGEVMEFNRLPHEAIDLVANGKLIAKGELVEIDGRLGVRILKIFD